MLGRGVGVATAGCCGTGVAKAWGWTIGGGVAGGRGVGVGQFTVGTGGGVGPGAAAAGMTCDPATPAEQMAMKSAPRTRTRQRAYTVALYRCNAREKPTSEGSTLAWICRIRVHPNSFPCPVFRKHLRKAGITSNVARSPGRQFSLVGDGPVAKEEPLRTIRTLR